RGADPGHPGAPLHSSDPGGSRSHPLKPIANAHAKELPAMLKVLIIDDQPAVRTALETLFEVHGLPAVSVGSPEEGLHLLATEDIGAVVQDMNFTQENTDGAEGAKLFRTIRELDPEMPVLLMTAWTALETAVSLTKEGAADAGRQARSARGDLRQPADARGGAAGGQHRAVRRAGVDHRAQRVREGEA